MDKPPRKPHHRKARSRCLVKGQKLSSIPKATLWSLPQEVILHILQNLHVRDLLNFSSTHSYFNDLIKNNPSIWQNVSFHGTWPSVPNMGHFMSAAEHSNIEALVKLGVAFLYNEGLPGDFEGKKITTNGERAAEMFCKVESSTPATSPFTWLFIRPPWAVAGACCKECVFNNMKEYVQQTPDPSIHICIAKTLGILGVEEHKDDIEKHLTLAKDLGSQEAAFLLWTQKYCQCCRVLDRALDLASLRDLRQIAQSGYYEGQLALSKRYVCNKYGGISHQCAANFVRGFVQSSRPTRVKNIYRFNELTHSMRYILMDWLVEVACMKDFSSLTLHMAVSVVDRFLQKHKTTRAMLQLLGVAAMVLCSRVLGMEIITIREAAWLTDNTYKYEDVVRMMGEVTATLGGKFRMPVSLDYVELMVTAIKSDNQTTLLAEYLCELALLQSDLGDFPRAQVAASCVFLARIIQKKENPWPSALVEFTGFTATGLHKCVLLLHSKCFMDQAMVDHRDVVLQAVKERYSDEEFMCVSQIKVMNKSDLCTLLGVSEEKPAPVPVKASVSPRKEAAPNPKDLIASPCRGAVGSKACMKKCVLMELDRDQAATPSLRDKAATPSLPTAKSVGKLNVSVSGYDGDREDEGESFMNVEGYESDPDLESLWCTDHKWTESHSRVEVSSAEEDCSYSGVPPVICSSLTGPQGAASTSVVSTASEVKSFTFGWASSVGALGTYVSPTPSTSDSLQHTLKPQTNHGPKAAIKIPDVERLNTVPCYRDNFPNPGVLTWTAGPIQVYKDPIVSCPAADSGIEMTSRGLRSFVPVPRISSSGPVPSPTLPPDSSFSHFRVALPSCAKTASADSSTKPPPVIPTCSSMSSLPTSPKPLITTSTKEHNERSHPTRLALATLSTSNCQLARSPRKSNGRKRKQANTKNEDMSQNKISKFV